MADLLRAKEVQQEFGFSRQSLLRFEQQGLLQPNRTPGGQRRYSRSQIQSLLSTGRVGAGNAQPSAEGELASGAIYSELGVTGLRRWGGSVYEERLQELRGRQGRILYREMRLNDPVVSAIFFAVGNAIRQADWRRIIPASDSAADKEAAEFLEQCLDDMSWSWMDQLTFCVDPMLEQGFSMLEVVYKKRLGDQPPEYIESPAPSRYDDNRIGWRKWAPRPAESLMDGNEWTFDENGGIQGINQAPDTGEKPRFLGIRKLLHFRTTVHPANNPEGLPIHRAMYVPWYYSNQLMEIEGIGIERDLNGIPIVYLGEDCTLSGPNSDYELAVDLVTQIRNDEQAGVVIPKPKMGTGAAEGRGMLLELLSAQGRRAHDTNEIIERYDKRKALAVLTQFIMLGMEQVGSFALSRHQGDLFVLAVTAWAQSIADVINRHAIPKLFRFNTFNTPNGMPVLEPGAIGIPDLELLADYVNKLVDKQVLVPDDELERHFRQAGGMPTRDPETAREIQLGGMQFPDQQQPQRNSQPNNR